MNNMVGINEFIRLWDLNKQFQGSFSTTALQKNPLNSINICGDYLKDSSLILTKNENDFYSAIESGIKELVSIIVSLGWITYSSCEGHNSYQRVPYKKRVVQILPRNEVEKSHIFNTLNAASSKANNEALNHPIVVKIIEEGLIGEERSYLTVKILFDGQNCDEIVYFNLIDNAYTNFIKHLNNCAKPK